MNLAQVAQAYRQALPAGRLHLFRVDALDRLGMPVVTAAFTPELGKSCESFGYGLTDEEAAVGALGELTEELRAAAVLRTMPREAGSYAELCRRHGPDAVLDPLRLCLPAGSDYTPDTPLTWVAARRWRDRARVSVPLEAVAVDQAQLDGLPSLFTPITNGLGAGLTLEQALAHGALELLQRDGNVLSYRALDPGVVVDLDEVRDPAVIDLIERLRGKGIDVTVKLAATDFDMANLFVVGFDHGSEGFPLQVTACGEAVHPDREVALRKALAEFVSSRSRKSMRHGDLDLLRRVAPEAFLEARLRAADPEKEEPRALAAMMDWVRRDRDELRELLKDTMLAERERVPFSSLPTESPDAVRDPADRLRVIIERLEAAGLDLHYVDLSDEGAEVRAVKVIVPELEAETMSYHRIGERGVQRLRARGNLFLADHAGAGSAPVRLTTAAGHRLGGPVWLDIAAIDRAVGNLYALYREPAGQTVQLALQAERAGRARVEA